MKKEMIRKRAVDIGFIVILIIHIICWIMYADNREITGDEFFSYGLANGTEDYIFWDMNQIDAHSNEGGWIQGTDIQSYLQVDEGERFSFSRVWWNQEHDVHPTFYYTLLNTVSSFFPGVYSKWLGKSISIFFLILTEVVLYRLSILYLGKKPSALIPGLLWGMTAGTFFLGALVRMYAMLCFFCILLVLFHTRLVLYEFQRKDFILLAVTVMAGGLTHYYFYLFLVLYGGLFFMLLLLKKEPWKRILSYCISVILGGVTAILIFPAMLRHIFGGYRGDDVKSMLFSPQFRLTGFLGLMNEDLFNGRGIPVLLVTVLCLIACLLVRKGKIKVTDERKLQIWTVTLLAGVFYGAAMMKMSISVRTAYISPCYAVLELVIYIAAIRLLSFMKENRRMILLTCLSFLLVFTTVPGIMQAQRQRDTPLRQFKEEFAAYEGTDCIFVYDSWNNLFGNHLELMAKESEIYCVDAAKLQTDEYPQNTDRRRDADPLVVFIPDNEDTESRMAIMEERLNMQAKKVLTGEYCVYQLQ